MLNLVGRIKILKINRGRGREKDREISMQVVSKIDRITIITHNPITVQPVSDLSPLSTCNSPNAQHT